MSGKTTRDDSGDGERLGGKRAAHELNNILGAIAGYARFVIDDAPAGSATAGHAHKILAAVEMGTALAKRLALEANESR
ncbi:MAG TPA: hypothetical protein VFS04_12595 [Alphaproteobacteria bacterium]|nr:hypothetical protein [Alphaproteobacteria bacterium]